MSLNTPIKEIAEKFQLTSTHPPRSSTTLGDKPITPGAVIAAPLQTAASWLGDRALTGDKQPPGHADCHTSCKNTLPQTPKSETALTGKEHPALDLWFLSPVPGGTWVGGKALQGTFLSREQKAATFPEQCSGLLGVVSPLNGVKSAQGKCVLPKVITEVRSLLTQNLFLTLGIISQTEPPALSAGVAMGGAGT